MKVVAKRKIEEGIKRRCFFYKRKVKRNKYLLKVNVKAVIEGRQRGVKRKELK